MGCFSLRCFSCSSGICLLSPLNSSSLLRNLLIPGRLCPMVLFIQNVSVDATGTIIGLHLLLHNLGQVRSNSGNESLLDCVCCLSGDLRVRVGSLGSSAIVLDASSSLLKGLAASRVSGFQRRLVLGVAKGLRSERVGVSIHISASSRSAKCGLVHCLSGRLGRGGSFGDSSAPKDA